jgi:hypothetical protein
MAQSPGVTFPLFQLPPGLLDRVVGCLELWDLAAARLSCQTLRTAAGRRARRLVFSAASLQCECNSDQCVQVGQWALQRGCSGDCCVALAQPATARNQRPSRRAGSPSPQKRCPTAFQLFPNAREVVLVAADWDHRRDAVRRVDVLDVFRPPSAPADAAAARAALAGVTRLEMTRGRRVKRVQLADALMHLPGLREVSLACEFKPKHPRGPEGLAEGLVATLAWRPSLESLEWDVTAGGPAGALGSRGGRRSLGQAGPRGPREPLVARQRAFGRNALMPWALCGVSGLGCMSRECASAPFLPSPNLAA